MLKLRATGPASRGVLASLFNLGASTAFLVLQVPILVGALSPAGYRQWAVTMSVPLLLSLTDIGFSTAGATAAAALWSQERRSASRNLFRSYSVLAIGLPSASAVALAGLAFLGVLHLPNGALSSNGERAAFCLLLLWALVTMGWSLCESALRVCGHFPLGLTVLGIGRLGDLVSLGVASVVHPTIGGMTAALLIWRLAGLVPTLALCLRRAAPLVGREGSFTWVPLRPLVAPSLGAAAFPLALNISSQGLLLIAAQFLGPREFVLLSTVRLLAGLMRQLSMAIGVGVIPEYTRAYATGSSARVAFLTHRLRSLIGATGLVAVAGTLLAGDLIIHVLTRGLSPEYRLLLVAAVIMVMDAAWVPSFARATARNQQAHLGVAAIIAACAGLAAGFALRDAGTLGFCVGLAAQSLILMTWSLALDARAPKGSTTFAV